MNTRSASNSNLLNRAPYAACVLAAMIATGCSPGTLPGAPSTIVVGGGGGRYNGTMTYRRLGGAFTLTESPQNFDLSIVLRAADQVTGRFQSPDTFGTIQGTLSGDLAAGTLTGNVLVVTTARQPNGTPVSCEGRGEATGVLSGRNLSWNITAISFGNCAGLSASSTAQAVATSPIPADFQGRSNVVISVIGGPSVRRGTCANGATGYPFTVEMIETAGIVVTFDSTFLVEEHRNFSAAGTTSVLDMPFTQLTGGARRLYEACSSAAGTYQAFFSGTDASGARLLMASPLVTFVP